MRTFIRRYPNIVYLCNHDYSETKKEKENIAEYLLYMWQVEDLIRANDFDMDSIRRTVVDRYDQPDDVKEEIAKWYEELIEMMRSGRGEGERTYPVEQECDHCPDRPAPPSSEVARRKWCTGRLIIRHSLYRSAPCQIGR